MRGLHQRMGRAGEGEHLVVHGVIGLVPLYGEALFSPLHVTRQRADGETVALERRFFILVDVDDAASVQRSETEVPADHPHDGALRDRRIWPAQPGPARLV